MGTGIGSIQVEIIKALAAIEAAKPGRTASITELVHLIFDTDTVSEAQRVTVTRALAKLEKDEKMVIRAGMATREVRWRLHNNIIRTLVRPEGIDYSKRVARLTKFDEAAQ
jgi:hypothetical protein